MLNNGTFSCATFETNPRVPLCVRLRSEKSLLLDQWFKHLRNKTLNTVTHALSHLSNLYDNLH